MRYKFTTDNQYFLVGAGTDEISADVQAIEEAGAGRVDVDRCCVAGTDGILNY